MGTNYYVDGVGPDPDSGEARLHIGKASAGWRFLFHEVTYGDRVLDSARAWYKFLYGREIVDEYGECVTREDLFAWIDRRALGYSQGRRGEGPGETADFARGEFC